MENDKKKIDSLSTELLKEEEARNKKMIIKMYVITSIACLIYVGVLYFAIYKLEEGPLLGTIICVATIIFVLICFYGLKLEVDAGYYECKNCHHKYVPDSYFKALMAPHMNTTRYMRCPKCDKKSWAKKVFTKDDINE